MNVNLVGSNSIPIDKRSWEWKVSIRIIISRPARSVTSTNRKPFPSYIFHQVRPNQITWIELLERNKFEIPYPDLYQMEGLYFRKAPAVKSGLHEKAGDLLHKFKRVSKLPSRPVNVHLVLKYRFVPPEQLIRIPSRRDSDSDDTHNRRLPEMQHMVDVQPPPSATSAEGVTGGEISNQLLALQYIHWQNIINQAILRLFRSSN